MARHKVYDQYDRGLNFDPRNFVGYQVADAIHERTGLNGDFTTGMGGRTCLRIANDIHNRTDHAMSRAHGLFNYHWKGDKS